MKKTPIYIMLFVSLGMIAIGFLGLFNSNSTKKTAQDDTVIKDDYDIEKLYNYVKGFSYEYISDDLANPGYIYSELHQGSLVTVDTLTNESILRAAIKQLVICDGDYYHKAIHYDVIANKINEIVGKNIDFEAVTVIMTQGVGQSGYMCDINGCIPEGGTYCSTMPLTSDYTMVSHKIENEQLIIIDQDINSNQYKHTFKKNSNGNYYWISSEPIFE